MADASQDNPLNAGEAASERADAPEQTVHHEPAAKKRRRPGGVKELNLTSMLDVTFQLLIFFILTANFAMDEGVLAANLPQGTSAAEEQEEPEEPLRIVLTPSGPQGEQVNIVLDGRERLGNDFQRLYETLNGWRYDPRDNPQGVYEQDHPIIIEPGTRGAAGVTNYVRWEHVVSAFNACVRARYSSVSFAQSN